jgi:SNF2 family DNA or RNA helicase
MISKQAVTDFLSRDLGNHDWLKSIPAEKLDAELKMLKPRPDFNGMKPWDHQKAGLLLALELKRFMYFWDMGGGKTLLSLMLLKYLKQCGKKPKAIVFVPYITSVSTWVDEVAKHAPDLECVALTDRTDINLSRLRYSDGGDLFVICYQSAVAMVSYPVTTKKGKKKWDINATQIRDYFKDFNILICDEIHRCKNHAALTYRMCRAISSTSEYVLGLTGTPFGRDLQDLWAQFYLLDFGETLGETLGLYRSAFFKEKKNYWGGFDYTFKQKLMPDLQRIIKHRSIRYTIDEFADMPSKKYVQRILNLHSDSSGYVAKALTDLRDAVKGKRYRQVESSYLQLRQLSSGFMTLKGEDNDKLQVQFDSNPKLEAVVQLIEDMPPGSKCVIFHHFIYSNGVISDRLAKLAVPCARVWGGSKDPIGELRRFKSDPACRVLVLNWRSGSSSLNLQHANYMIVYEQPDSPIDRKQGEARLWRPGQQQRVWVYDLLVKGTVDQRMHAANLAGKSLLEELLDGQETL